MNFDMYFEFLKYNQKLSSNPSNCFFYFFSISKHFEESETLPFKKQILSDAFQLSSLLEINLVKTSIEGPNLRFIIRKVFDVHEFSKKRNHFYQDAHLNFENDKVF
jgi:hypothetical protein